MKRSVEDMIAAAAQIFEMPIVAIVGAAKHREILYPRFSVCHLALSEGHSSVMVGRKLKRNHASILNGRDKVEVWLQEDPDFTKTYQRFCQMVREKSEQSHAARVKLLHEYLDQKIDHDTAIRWCTEAQMGR